MNRKIDMFDKLLRAIITYCAQHQRKCVRHHEHVAKEVEGLQGTGHFRTVHVIKHGVHVHEHTS